MDAISIKFTNCSDNQLKTLIDFLWDNDFEVSDYKWDNNSLIITGYATCEDVFHGLFGYHQPNNIYDFCKKIGLCFEHIDMTKLGWLDLRGNFYPVINDEHQRWAYKYLKDHMDIEDFNESDLDQTNSGDYLVEKGWVLLHSPGTENIVFEHNQLMGFTKAQQNFLHDYCIDNKLMQKISELFE